MTRRLAAALALSAAACSHPTPPTPPPPTTTSPPEPPAPTTAPTTAPPPQVAAHPPRPAPAEVVATSEGGEAAERAVETPEAVVPAGEVEAAICAAWGDECAAAIRVARCESGLRPAARNGAHFGLFQVATDVHAARIGRMGFTLAQMLEVGPNIAVARALYEEQGWRPWTCAA